MRHTKGKWKAAKNSQYMEVRGGSNGYRVRINCFLYRDDEDIHLSEENQAIANLISKAPEMYELIKECRQHLMDLRGYDEINDLLKEIES